MMAQSDKVTRKKTRARRPGESLTPEQIESAKETFITAYTACGNVGAACDKAAISRTTFYRWQEHDEAFGFAYEQAKAEYCDSLRQEITRRARDGVLKPVFQGGEKVGSIREYSDVLLMFEAKRHMPEYRDKVSINTTMQGAMSDDITTNPIAALHATLFAAALQAGDTDSEGDSGGPRVSRE